MTLVLGIIRCPEGAAPETRSFTGGEFTVGRGADCDWVLPDPDRVLSKVHCRIALDGNGWHLADASTNGTFLNHEVERVGPDAARVLREGDRVILGGYEMEVSFEADASVSVSAEPSGSGPAGSFRPWDEARGAVGMKPDALRLDPAEPSGQQPFGFDGLGSSRDPALDQPTANDHAPFLRESFRPPAPRPILPDDWDRPDDWNRTVEPPPPRVADPDVPPPPQDPPPSQPPAASAVAASAPDDPDVLAALFAGAAIDRRHLGDPVPLLRSMGAAFRAVVIGLRRIMIARAAIKGEFRIEQTTIRVRGNNPLKFAANDDDALSALMGDARASDMTPEAAVSDALRDMRLHELAMASAMQQAVREMLDRLGPERVSRGVAASALDTIPALRHARLWRAYVQNHDKVREAFDDDFDSVFGKAFARAYERAIGELAESAER
ncbi:MAG: type VI secretion system-associated FHA domain protein TagH [Gluconacetobacter diazotrophicus]|nr:type VI secretion system-associated FHA domain protein TagH [Gluconacetobacter diazotrophicus]